MQTRIVISRYVTAFDCLLCSKWTEIPFTHYGDVVDPDVGHGVPCGNLIYGDVVDDDGICFDEGAFCPHCLTQLQAALVDVENGANMTRRLMEIANTASGGTPKLLRRMASDGWEILTSYPVTIED